MMGAGMARWLAGSRWSTRPNAAVVEALARLGLLEHGRDAALRAAHRRGLVRHLAGRAGARAGLRQARAGQAPGRRRLARADRAQRLRGRLDAPRRGARAGCGAGAARPGRARRACWSWPISPAGPAIAAGRPSCSPAAPSRRWPRRSANAWRKSMPATAHEPTIAAAFPTDRIFHDIRLEPYLGRDRTGASRPRRGAARAWSRSPRPPGRAPGAWRCQPQEHPGRAEGPVFLDAECAWYGDPAFDLAFCLNHLLLKCLWAPARRERFLALLRRAGRKLSRRASPGSRRRRSRRARRICCRGCCSAGSTASRRSSI